MVQVAKQAWKPLDEKVKSKNKIEERVLSTCGYSGYKIVDTMALILFAITFFIFNVLYWGTYAGYN